MLLAKRPVRAHSDGQGVFVLLTSQMGGASISVQLDQSIEMYVPTALEGRLSW